MARKRGGLAGLYDRNKGLIQGAAPVVAGMFGGPLAGAAVGAAMKGLDREGKSGIGLDLGKAAMGGVTGYAAGGMGKSLAGGLKGRLAGLFSGGGGATGGMPALPAPNMQVGVTPGMASKGFSVAPVTSAPSMAAAPSMVPKGQSALSRAAAFIEKNPNTIGQAAKLAMSAAGPDNDARALELKERQYQDEQEAAGRRASIVSDLLAGQGGAFNRMRPAQMNEGYGSMNSYLEATAPEGMENERQRRLAASRFAQTMRGGGAFGMPTR